MSSTLQNHASSNRFRGGVRDELPTAGGGDQQVDPGAGGAGEGVPEPGDAGQRVGPDDGQQRREDRLSQRGRGQGQAGPAGRAGAYFTSPTNPLIKLCDAFQRLEHELDFIKGQQSELEDLLRPLESSLTTAPPPDPERERTYQLAETLDAQLQRMSDDLREVIEHLNTANR